MKRWISIILALSIFMGLFQKNKHQTEEALKDLAGIKYASAKTYFDNPAWIKLSLGEKDQIIFGSSEFASGRATGFHPNTFLNHPDSEPVLIGRGYTEALYHTMALGAIEEAVASRKVVLIVSPQWFLDTASMGPEFSSTFSKAHYQAFMANPRISEGLKEEVTACVLTRLTGDGPTRRQIRKESLDKDTGLLAEIETLAQEVRKSWKAYFDLMETAEEAKALHVDAVQADKYPSKALFEAKEWQELDRIAEFHGRNEATNNPYFIRDGYFKSHTQRHAVSGQTPFGDRDYAASVKFSDLELFLRVCQETGIQPLVVSVPVNGRWYDWAGYPQAKRALYYEQIRSICTDYGADLADFSDRDYDPYFLFDTMHLGRKGWTYVSRAIQDFYQVDQ